MATVATGVARAGGGGGVDVRRMALAAVVAKAPAAVTAMAAETAAAVGAEALSTAWPVVRALLLEADLLSVD